MALLDIFSSSDSRKAKAPQGRSQPGDMDILDKLKAEHDEVKALLGKLVDSGKAAERTALLKKIKAALVPHTRAEEKVVYDAILAVRGDKEAKVDGNEGYYEHAHADMALKTLAGIKPATSPEFTAAAKVLKELVEHHVQEEERNVWRDVRKHFNAEQRTEMNRKFETAKKRVKVS